MAKSQEGDAEYAHVSTRVQQAEHEAAAAHERLVSLEKESNERWVHFSRHLRVPKRTVQCTLLVFNDPCWYVLESPIKMNLFCSCHRVLRVEQEAVQAKACASEAQARAEEEERRRVCMEQEAEAAQRQVCVCVYVCGCMQCVLLLHKAECVSDATTRLSVS